MKKRLVVMAIALASVMSGAVASEIKLTDNPWKDVNKVLKKIKAPKFKEKNVFDITKYGAVNGVEDYTVNAVNKAIDAAAAAGGGQNACGALYKNAHFGFEKQCKHEGVVRFMHRGR